MIREANALVVATIILGIVFAITAIIRHAHGSERVQCAERQVTWQYHSYQVEGRRCWARGRPGKYEPSDLYWPTPIRHLYWEQEYRWQWQDPAGWSHRE